MRRITTESIVRIVIGVCSPERDAEIRRLVREMLEIAENPLALMPQFQRELGGRSPFGKVMEVTRQIDAILHDEIGLRRRCARHERGADVLSTLAGPEPHEDGFMTDREIRDEMPDAADRRPRDDRERALLGVRAAAAPSRRPSTGCSPSSGPTTTRYLDAVVRETLRQRPILPITARRLTAEIDARRATPSRAAGP